MADDYSIIVKNVSKKFKLIHASKNPLLNYITSALSQTKSSDDLVVLDDISFSVKKGEMLGIIGLNGCGKTTLLKIIAQIYAPDKGTISTNGKMVPFLEIGTGFNGELTARENIVIYGVILGFTKKDIEAKVDDIAKFADIEKFLDTKVKNFSAGMNARLAFSTAIQVDPDILLVDEILSVGDILFQKKSFESFMDFKKKGKTIIFVSHSIDQVKNLCDRVLWIHKGKIFDQGKPLDVINRYRDFADNEK